MVWDDFVRLVQLGQPAEADSICYPVWPNMRCQISMSAYLSTIFKVE